MSEKMHKRERYGAIAGLALLAFAMAYRWVFPVIERIEWWRPGADAAEVARMERIRELAAAAESEPEPATGPDAVTSAVEVVPEVEPEASTELDEAQRKQVDTWLAAGELAVLERRWAQPEDDNALKWFGDVLGIDPGNSKARSSPPCVGTV